MEESVESRIENLTKFYKSNGMTPLDAVNKATEVITNQLKNSQTQPVGNEFHPLIFAS